MVLIHVMNTITNAVSTFSWDFNSYAEIDGKYYGVDATGMYQLDASSFDRQDAADGIIEAHFITGELDFGTEVLKRIESFYMTMRATGDVTLNVYTELGLIGSYRLAPTELEALKQVRSLLGKGARGRYWQFELITQDDFDFDTYDVLVAPTSRRI